MTFVFFSVVFDDPSKKSLVEGADMEVKTRRKSKKVGYFFMPIPYNT